MKTYYSVLFSVLTQETSERISLGLLLSDGEKSLFRYSRSKLTILKELVSGDEHKFIRNYLNTMKEVVGKSGLPKTELFKEEELAPLLVNEGYIEYLSRYNQNVLTFGKPVNVNVNVNEESFSKLFKMLINEKEPTVQYQRHKLERVKNEFIPKVSAYYNYNREVLPEEYSGLILPVKIDLLGQNEIPVFAQFLDFERKIQFIKNDYYDLKQLSEVLKNGKGFIVSSEPDELKYAQQHSAWNAIRKSDVGEYLDLTEVEKIKEYAEMHGVKPL